MTTLKSVIGVLAGDRPAVTGGGARWQPAEILIIDNDQEPTAEAAVSSLAALTGNPCPLRYVHEPQPGLTAARNRALEETTADVLVFIDDDEIACPGWPDGLIATMATTGATLVGGPVRTSFAKNPPDWVINGGFFDRPEPATGTEQIWLRSGNLAIDMTKIRSCGLRFDDRFSTTGGEDVDFSRRAAKLGLGLQWNNEAAVIEEVGPERTTIGWLVGRERRSTANWVRAELLGEPGSRTRARIAARVSIRLAQGIGLAAAGIATSDPGRRNQGRVRLARGLGGWDGLLGRAAPAYGADG